METLIEVRFYLDELRNLVPMLDNFDARIPIIKADIVDAYNQLQLIIEQHYT